MDGFPNCWTGKDLLFWAAHAAAFWSLSNYFEIRRKDGPVLYSIMALVFRGLAMIDIGFLIITCVRLAKGG